MQRGKLGDCILRTLVYILNIYTTSMPKDDMSAKPCNHQHHPALGSLRLPRVLFSWELCNLVPLSALDALGLTAEVKGHRLHNASDC